MSLEQAKKETDNILHNVEEGFFILNDKNKIGLSYSAALENIFQERKLAKRSLIAYLKAKIDKVDMEDLLEYLSIMRDKSVDELYLKKLNPLDQIKLNFKDKEIESEKYLNIIFKRIQSNGNSIKDLFVTARDITKSIKIKEKLDKAELEKEKMLQLVSSLLDTDPDIIKDFFEETEKDVKQLDNFITQSDNKQGIKKDIDEIFRLINLIRMNSQAINLPSLSNQAKISENIVNRIKTKDPKYKNEEINLIKNYQLLKNEFNTYGELIKLIYDSMLEFHTKIKKS